MVVDPEVKANAEEDWVDLVKLKEVVGAQEMGQIIIVVKVSYLGKTLFLMRQSSEMPHRLNNNSDGDDDNGSDGVASTQQAQRITGFSRLTKMYWNLLSGDTRLAVLGRDVKYI
jgi:hypothetical protein